MPYSLTARQIEALIEVISAPRFETYLRARYRNRRLALALYQWNTQVCGAFLVPQQFCEVAVRNGIAGAVERVYGPNWPWSTGFERSLPDPPFVPGRPSPFSPKKELQRARRGAATPGQVVAEMKLAFWVDMFTSRHDGRIWRPHLRTEFPHLPTVLTVPKSRNLMREQLDRMRRFRNRVAHHEPVFARDLAAEYARMRWLVASRSQQAAAWLDGIETVTTLLGNRP